MSKRTERNNRRPKAGGPSRAAKQMLYILSVLRRDVHVYEGTVPKAEIHRRRAANKRARISRRLNRNG